MNTVPKNKWNMHTFFEAREAATTKNCQHLSLKRINLGLFYFCKCNFKEHSPLVTLKPAYDSDFTYVYIPALWDDKLHVWSILFYLTPNTNFHVSYCLGAEYEAPLGSLQPFLTHSTTSRFVDLSIGLKKQICRTFSHKHLTRHA